MGRLFACPDCGANVSKSAASCPSCGRVLKKAAKQYGCGTLLAGAMALGVAAIVISAINSPRVADRPNVAVPTKMIKVGDHVILEVPKANRIFLATTDDAWDELIDAENAASQELIVRLINQGKAFSLPNNSKATVIKTAFASMFVRISEGELSGNEGWIQREFVKPSP